ncbi:hypothetical protein GCM10027615_29430 [Plantactinospora veratri]
MTSLRDGPAWTGSADQLVAVHHRHAAVEVREDPGGEEAGHTTAQDHRPVTDIFVQGSPRALPPSPRLSHCGPRSRIFPVAVTRPTRFRVRPRGRDRVGSADAGARGTGARRPAPSAVSAYRACPPRCCPDSRPSAPTPRAAPPPLPVPLGVPVFPRDSARPVRRFTEPAFPNIAQWHECDRGGHFAALEEPDLFVDDLRQFAQLPNRRRQVQGRAPATTENDKRGPFLASSVVGHVHGA